MKKISELKFEELTTEQKLGMSCAFLCAPWASPEDIDYVENLIRNHAAGTIWIPPSFKGGAEILKRLTAAADYPRLSFTDAEAGLGDYTIGRHNTLASCDSEELAYNFGKVSEDTMKTECYEPYRIKTVCRDGNRRPCGRVPRKWQTRIRRKIQ